MQAAIEKYLKAHDAGVSVGKSVSGHGNPYTDPEEVPADTECVITLGGDGTLIQAAKGSCREKTSDDRYQSRRPRLSYPDRPGRRCKGASGCAFGGLLELQERMMLKGCVTRNARPVKESIALNDIVLTRTEIHGY